MKKITRDVKLIADLFLYDKIVVNRQSMEKQCYEFKAWRSDINDEEGSGRL